MSSEHSSVPRPLGSTWKPVPMPCAGCGAEHNCLILFTDGKHRCVACQMPLLRSARGMMRR